MKRLATLALMLSSAAACRATTTAPPPANAMTPAQVEASEAAAPGALGVLAPDKLLERLLDEMSRDPRFSAAGDRVWEKLVADPVLAKHGASLLERVAESPAFQELLARQLAAGKTAEQIGQELEQKVTRALGDPAVDRAIDESFDALMERPKVDRAAQFWAVVLVKETGVTRTLAEVFLSPRWRRKWEGILGVQPSADILFQRIDGYLVSSEGQWAAQVIGDALVRDPLAKDIFLRALESPALTGIAIKVSRKLLDDQAFKDQVSKLLLTMMEGAAAPAISAAARRTLSDVPAVEAAIASSFLMMASERSLNQQMGEHVRRLILNLRDRQDVLDALTPTQRAGVERRTVY